MKDRDNIYMIYAEYKCFHNLEWHAGIMVLPPFYFTNTILFH